MVRMGDTWSSWVWIAERCKGMAPDGCVRLVEYSQSQKSIALKDFGNVCIISTIFQICRLEFSDLNRIL